MRNAVAVKCLLWGCGLVALTSAAAHAQQPPKYDEQKLPYRARWGAYTVQVVKQGKEAFDPERFRILDARGRVVKEIQGLRITDLQFPKLDPHGPPALQATGFTGGAHCCFVDYFFTRDRGVRNLLIFNGGNDSVGEIKDLNGDGRPEMIAGNDSLAYFGGVPYVFCAHLEMVIGWDGKQYVDQTRRYPKRALAQAQELRDELVKALHSKEEDAESQRRGAAAGYYASMLLAGQGASARAWLDKELPASTRDWLKENEDDLRKAVLKPTQRLRVDQRKVLEFKVE